MTDRHDPRHVHPASATSLEDAAWCEIHTAAGTSIRTNSVEGYVAGARFVAVLDPTGTQIGWWPSEAWSDEDTARDVLATIFSTAASQLTATSLEFGLEWIVPLAAGSLCAAKNGNYVRAAGPDGATVHNGAAYWNAEEFADDPEPVMGAVLGVAKGLS